MNERINSYILEDNFLGAGVSVGEGTQRLAVCIYSAVSKMCDLITPP